MAKEKNTFTLHKDKIRVLHQERQAGRLNDQEFSALMDAIFTYQLDGVDVSDSLPPTVQLFFRLIVFHFIEEEQAHMDFIVEQTNKINKRWGKPPVNAETVQPKPTVRKNRTVQPANTPTPKPAHVAELPVCAKNTTTQKDEYPEDFVQFWDVYPRTKDVSKRDAFSKYKTATGKTTVAVILNGAKNYRASCANTEQKFIKHPATWLHQELWKASYTPESTVKPFNDAKSIVHSEGWN